MRALGVRFDTPRVSRRPLPTGRCLILVTPDAQRTMNTCPGASHLLAARALDEELIASAAILYLEGYLCGPELPRAAMMKAIDIAHGAGREIAFTLSESVCIAGRKEAFGAMIDRGGVDLLFANEDEVLQLTGATRPRHARWPHLAAKVPTLVDHARGRGRAGDRRRGRGRGARGPRTAGGRHDRRRRPVRGRLPRRAGAGA